MSLPRLCLKLVLAALAFTGRSPAALEQEAEWLLEGQATAFDGERSWMDRGLGKLRGGDGDEQLAVRLALDYGLHFSETLSGHLTVDAYGGTDSNAGVTEAWLAWDPVPRSAWTYSVRAGSFIPPFSEEHVATGWTSAYMPTGSVLNSWIGEEVHTDGVELTVQRRGALTRSPHTLTFRVAAFQGNDTSGTLLSWRGWAANDRVTPYGDVLPLPERPALLPGGPFPGASRTDPFLEIDDDPGYYATAEWRYRRELTLSAGRYDNRADPLQFRGGQAGWRTEFNVAGAHWRPDDSTDVIAQYLEGSTLVGRRGSTHSADNPFKAFYLLLAHGVGNHRLGARYEQFEVTDRDSTPLDDNREDGDGWAVSWEYRWSGGASLAAEYLALDYDRPERAQLGLGPSVSEEQLRVNLRYWF